MFLQDEVQLNRQASGRDGSPTRWTQRHSPTLGQRMRYWAVTCEEPRL